MQDTRPPMDELGLPKGWRANNKKPIKITAKTQSGKTISCHIVYVRSMLYPRWEFRDVSIISPTTGKPEWKLSMEDAVTCFNRWASKQP